jgi:hypothetical protein
VKNFIFVKLIGRYGALQKNSLLLHPGASESSGFGVDHGVHKHSLLVHGGGDGFGEVSLVDSIGETAHTTVEMVVKILTHTGCNLTRTVTVHADESSLIEITVVPERVGHILYNTIKIFPEKFHF